MYLDNPRSVERDNQNSLRKYPFADTAACGNGAVVIPPGAVIDVQLYVPGRAAGRVWVSAVDSDGRLRFSDGAGEFACTSQPVQPLSAVPVTFTGDGGPLPGGVVVCGRNEDVAALLRAGRQEFTADQAELASAAVTFTGSMGVTGFRLDDGHTVWGNVRIRGANGCDVATYVKGGVKYLRISAVGRAASTDPVTGFIKRVVAHSDNSNFTVAPLTDADGDPVNPNRCVLISPTGAWHLGDGDIPYDQDDACAAVKKARGTLPSASATVPPDCGDPCADPPDEHTITLMSEGTEVARITARLGLPLETSPLPEGRSGWRFTGYYRDMGSGGQAKKYYRPDGTGIGRFDVDEDVTLHAHWIASESSAVATFDGYGTLHLLAPDADLPAYSNPLRISGQAGRVPPVRTITQDELADGGAETIADAVLHPETAAGEIHLALRGLRKAFDS